VDLDGCELCCHV